MENINKKGQILDNLGALAIGIVILGITLVIAFLIMAQADTVNTNSFIDSATVLGESLTYSDGAYVALANSPNSIELSCDSIRNGSTGIVIGTGNYTCDTNGVLLNGADWNTTILVNYTHSQANAAWNATTDLRNATEGIPAWVPLIVIAVIGALLLGIISMFRR